MPERGPVNKRRIMENVAEILDYQPAHQQSFERLNRQWIEKYFAMEPPDFPILEDPETHILRDGGFVIMALYNGMVAGTVAMKRHSAALFELTKMAVDEKFRGKKIGQALAEAAIDRARRAGATRIVLYSNTILRPAIGLYTKLGFTEIPVDGPYKRSNIKMELKIT